MWKMWPKNKYYRWEKNKEIKHLACECVMKFGQIHAKQLLKTRFNSTPSHVPSQQNL